MSDNPIHVAKIAREIKLQPNQVRAVRALLADDATVPFIARYRKEATGSLDEVQITAIRDRLEQLEELDQRREAIIKSLGERGLLTEELGKKLAAAETMTVLEDIYLPLRPKRRTRATIARAKGLEPLADFLFQNQTNAAADPFTEAHRFLVESEEKEKAVPSVEDAIAGARDILAERMNDDECARKKMRDLFYAKGIIKSKVVAGKEEDGAKFKDYFDWNEPAAKAPSHRILAVRRGESEGFLSVRIQPPEEEALSIVESDMNTALSQFESFLHTEEPIPALIFCALAHAQFETIHPFLDGNGRMGRLLITFLLCQRGILNRPLLYLSHYFKQHRAEYYDRLMAVRTDGHWEQWIKFFLRGVSEVSFDATATARKILELRETSRAHLSGAEGTSNLTHRLLDLLFKYPLVTIRFVALQLGCSFAKAAQLIEFFQRPELELVQETTGFSVLSISITSPSA